MRHGRRDNVGAISRYTNALAKDLTLPMSIEVEGESESGYIADSPARSGNRDFRLFWLSGAVKPVGVAGQRGLLDAC
jgi:hypothetical protein